MHFIDIFHIANTINKLAYKVLAIIVVYRLLEGIFRFILFNKNKKCSSKFFQSLLLRQQ